MVLTSAESHPVKDQSWGAKKARQRTCSPFAFFQRPEDIQQQEWQLWRPIDTVKLMWLALCVRSVVDDKVVIIDAKKYPIVTVIFYCVFNTLPIELSILAIGRISLK